MAQEFASVDDYIASFPADVAGVLEEARRVIRRAAPTAAESISYGMPTFSLGDRHLVYLAGWKKHVALYGVPDLGGTLQQELVSYRAEKGTLKFPLAKPLPLGLIERIVAEVVVRRGAEPS